MDALGHSQGWMLGSQVLGLIVAAVVAWYVAHISRSGKRQSGQHAGGM
jgi:hypothetical protein